MSLIYGVVYLDGRTVYPVLGENMLVNIGKYKLDKARYLNLSQGVLCCGMQYITPESVWEELPCTDNENSLTLTADAIIDNRIELFDLLGIPVTSRTRITDSELILLAYRKWREECPRYLVGDYAFVIWDDKEKVLFGARDHVGKRTFYYHKSDNCFAFCTTIKPILDLNICSRDLNDYWIADYLSLSSLQHEADCSKTVYLHVQQLMPGHWLKIDKNGMKVMCYWKPECKPELILKSNSEYEEAFLDVYSEAVNCRLRSAGSVGIMLSGGLDSASVAVLAARKLKETNQQLYAYSFVPFPEYKDWLPSHLAANEKEYIKEITNQYSNITVSFCDYRDVDPLSNIDELLSMLEHPYKIAANLYWINKMQEQIFNSGCRVVLDGQHGNCTVSAGDLAEYLLALLRNGRFIRLAREIEGCSKLHHISSLRVLKYFVKYIIPDNIISVYHQLSKRNDQGVCENDLIMVNPDYAKKHNSAQRLKQYELWPYYKHKLDMYDIRKQMNDPLGLSHVGGIETKLSLQHGIAKRDPTRDKRVIEFCMKLPIDQFVNNGQERSIIRRSLKGILPDKIRLNYYQRGRQSADYVQRVQKEWPDIEKELRLYASNALIGKYLDTSKLAETIKKVGNHPKDQDYQIIQMLLICLVFGRFILQERG